MKFIYKIIIAKINKKINPTLEGSLKVCLKDNKNFLIGDKESNIKIFIKKRFFILNLFIQGLPYLGFSYSKDYWTTNNLKKFLEFGLRNKNIFRNTIALNIFSNIYYYLITMFEANTISKSKRQISFHYDLGNKFYMLWLDNSMTYSSAIFGKSDDLANAQYNKYQSIAKAAQIKKKHSILEVGCGWGGFLKFVEKNIGSKITGITISKKQFDHINNKKLKKAVVELKDYRSIKDKFDRIVSIEMFEAVGKKNWNTYFKKLKECITDKGKIVLQVITINEENYNYYSHKKDFIQKYIFPGGMLPTKGNLETLAKNNDLSFKEYISFGRDYAKTLAIWKKNFFLNWRNIEKLGFDENFKRLWEYYLTYCEVGFKNGSINVGQYLLERNNINYEKK